MIDNLQETLVALKEENARLKEAKNPSREPVDLSSEFIVRKTNGTIVEPAKEERYLTENEKLVAECMKLMFGDQDERPEEIASTDDETDTPEYRHEEYRREQARSKYARRSVFSGLVEKIRNAPDYGDE